MTREIRSRRAGLSRDESRQQPLYSRLLGLQYVTPNGFLCFLFFEGAVALGILLALAELVSWWGVLALPVTVAVMVKLNDVVAGAVIQTPSTAARTSRTSASQAPASRTPASSRTPVPAELSFFADRANPATRTMPAAVPAVRRAAVRPAAATPATGYSATGYTASGYSAGGDMTGGYPDAAGSVAGDIRASSAADAAGTSGAAAAARASGAADAIRASGTVPAAVRLGHMPSAATPGSGASGGPVASHGLDVSPLNGPPVARHWEAPTERLDSPLRWARQAASRRYE